MTGTVITYPGAVYPPQTITFNGGTSVLSGVVSGLVTVGQFKRSLISSGVLQTVSDAIPADVTNPVNMQWFNGISIYANDALYTFVKNVLGYTPLQMSALMSYAATQQV